jgi:hypothetical protein
MTKKYLPLLLSVLTSNFTGTSCNFPKSASPPLATARTSLNGTTAPLKSPRTSVGARLATSRRIFECQVCRYSLTCWS